jgi:hypothetical protein
VVKIHQYNVGRKSFSVVAVSSILRTSNKDIALNHLSHQTDYFRFSLFFEKVRPVCSFFSSSRN